MSVIIEGINSYSCRYFPRRIEPVRCIEVRANETYDYKRREGIQNFKPNAFLAVLSLYGYTLLNALLRISLTRSKRIRTPMRTCRMETGMAGLVLPALDNFQEGEVA